MTEYELYRLSQCIKTLGEKMNDVIHLSLYNKLVDECGLSDEKLKEFMKPLQINPVREPMYVGSPRFGKTLEIERMLRRDQTTGNVFNLFPHQQKVMDSIRAMTSTPAILMKLDSLASFHTRYSSSFKVMRDEYTPMMIKPNHKNSEEPNDHQKMGKRMRNKVQVPKSEKQIVNGNKHTKKKVKRK